MNISKRRDVLLEVSFEKICGCARRVIRHRLWLGVVDGKFVDFHSSHRYRSPEKSEREIRRVIVQRSPSPLSRSSDHAARYRGRSRSRERSPHFRARRSRSRSRPRHDGDINSGPKSSVPVDGHSKPKEKGRYTNFVIDKFAMFIVRRSIIILY